MLCTCARTTTASATVGKSLPATFADRLASARISGKRRRGAAEVAPDEKVLTIACDDGTQFCMRPGVRGRVLELGARFTHTDLSTRARVGVVDTAELGEGGRAAARGGGPPR